MKWILLSVLVIGILLLNACAMPPSSTPGGSESPATQTTVVPEPKTWDKLTSEEHKQALDICSSLLRARLMGLAKSQAAYDFVSSFFTEVTTALHANGDDYGERADGQRMYIQCPDNAWWLKLYGMIPTGKTIEGEIDHVKIPLTEYWSPERWHDAVWLIYTDGTVVPWYNEFEGFTEFEQTNNAFNVEEDILKLNQGLELEYQWRQQ
jgi:hypothetical protein